MNRLDGVLSYAGHAVLEASTGEEALAPDSTSLLERSFGAVF
jgi:hypothetical protein